MRVPVSVLIAALVVGVSASVAFQAEPPAQGKARKVVKTDREWAKILPRDSYLVTRQKMTEPAFSGKYAHSKARGYYACIGCGSLLFSSKTKFDSGTGWPSFYAPVAPSKVDTEADNKMAEPRVEVLCNDCGAHLGHVFNDGPAPTGLRYCMNSVALKFMTEAQAKAAAEKDAEPKAPAKPDAPAGKTEPPDAPTPAAPSPGPGR